MGKALWRRAFDAAEAAVAPRVELLVRDGSFAGAVIALQRTTRFVTGALEHQTRRTWHAVNLPAGSDVLRLRRQVGDLDREVRLLREVLERQGRAQDEVPPVRRSRRGG